VNQRLVHVLLGLVSKNKRITRMPQKKNVLLGQRIHLVLHVESIKKMASPDVMFWLIGTYESIIKKIKNVKK
jgi:hypothetical protein